ncbi:hypothetical protein DXG01_013077, partial [Tephrocybe rancida]
LLDVSKLDLSFRRNLIVATQRLSTNSGHYPACYKLDQVVQVGKDFVSGGAFGDIYKGKFDDHVEISKETILWGQLSHPNILPFYGLFRFDGRVYFVSPWMEHGDIRMYLMHNPGAPRFKLALDVANGLAYLHENEIIHGDLKGPNILIDDAGRAVLADFGLSSVSDCDIIAWMSQSAGASKGGSVIWQAPELFDIQNDKIVNNTTASDVYAWGCVCFEIFTGERPFGTLNPTQVLLRVISGARPQRPEASSPPWQEWGLNEDVWLLMDRCWSQDPLQRPSAHGIVDDLTTKSTKYAQQDSKKEASSAAAHFRCQMSKPVDLATFRALYDILSQVFEVEDEKGLSQTQKWRNQQKQLRQTALLAEEEQLPSNTSPNTTSTDAMIIILGQTGAGKSTFINHLAGREIMSVGHGLEAYTNTVSDYTIPDPTSRHGQVILVDTPGFDDDDTNDLQINKRIVQWLTERGQMSPMKLVKSTIGANLVVASTKWSLLRNETVGFERQSDLEKLCSCKVHRFSDTTESAWDIVNMGLDLSASTVGDIATTLETVL